METVSKSKYASIREEIEPWDKECQRFGDVTMAMLMKANHKVPIHLYPLKGHYIWGSDFKDFGTGEGDEGLIYSLKLEYPRPWLYHYPAKGKFWFVQEKVNEFKSNWELED